jgi:hypothetical protein
MEDLRTDDKPCDTLEVSYQLDIVPILSNHCYTCHSNSNAPGFGAGIALEDYEDVASYSRPILGAISHEQGYPEMPRGGEQLDSCLISTFRSWHGAGSPEN